MTLSMSRRSCLNVSFFYYTVDDFLVINKNSCWDLSTYWDIIENKLCCVFLLFFLFVRPDRSSGWQRENVWVGSLPADHLLQKSRQLQSHQDPIQPPRKQGVKTRPGLCTPRKRCHHTCCTVMRACHVQKRLCISCHKFAIRAHATVGSSSWVHAVTVQDEASIFNSSARLQLIIFSDYTSPVPLLSYHPLLARK